MTYILGIDPGLTGAFALYNTETKRPFDITDLPILEINGKGHLDIYALASKIGLLHLSYDIARAIIEEPAARPARTKTGQNGGQGISSMFRFGKTCGQIEGVIAGLGISMHKVTPATWKRAMGLTSDKDHARLKAGQLWPSVALQFSRKKDDGRAESALLAYYGAEHLKIHA